MVPFKDKAGAVESMIFIAAGIDGSQSNKGKLVEQFLLS